MASSVKYVQEAIEDVVMMELPILRTRTAPMGVGIANDLNILALLGLSTIVNLSVYF